LLLLTGQLYRDRLETFSDNPGNIYGASSIDKAMMNCFNQTRKFVMAEYNITEAEAWTIITQGVNFGITQVVDGNWGVHAIIPKAIFEKAEPSACPGDPTSGAVFVPVFLGVVSLLTSYLML
jgi:acetamidase/formamidase